MAREVAARQPRLRAIPRDELAGCGAPDHGEVTLPDMMMALWNRPADRTRTHAVSRAVFARVAGWVLDD